TVAPRAIRRAGMAAEPALYAAFQPPLSCVSRLGRGTPRRLVRAILLSAGHAPRLEPPLRRARLPPVSVCDSPLGRSRPRARAAREACRPWGGVVSRGRQGFRAGLGCVSVLSARGNDTGPRLALPRPGNRGAGPRAERDRDPGRRTDLSRQGCADA